MLIVTVDSTHHPKAAPSTPPASQSATTVPWPSAAQQRGINAGVEISIICMIGGGRLSATLSPSTRSC